MRYVGNLKSFCSECKINSPQNTKSAESQTKQTKQDDCEKIQNDNPEINSPQNTISLESQTENTEKYSL